MNFHSYFFPFLTTATTREIDQDKTKPLLLLGLNSKVWTTTLYIKFTNFKRLHRIKSKETR